MNVAKSKTLRKSVLKYDFWTEHPQCKWNIIFPVYWSWKSQISPTDKKKSPTLHHHLREEIWHFPESRVFFFLLCVPDLSFSPLEKVRLGAGEFGISWPAWTTYKSKEEFELTSSAGGVTDTAKFRWYSMHEAWVAILLLFVFSLNTPWIIWCH